MAIVSSVTVFSDVPYSDIPEEAHLRKKRFTVVLTDNNTVEFTSITFPQVVDESDDGAAIAAELLQAKKDNELVEGDKLTQWEDSQNDYDRRALGQAMTISDVDEFYSFLPLFKAMESRGGANRNQRAAYLDVPVSEYIQMEDRFNDVEGIAFFLDNAKGQIWDEVLPGWD